MEPVDSQNPAERRGFHLLETGGARPLRGRYFGAFSS
jgi:hypothetical protein